MTSDNKLPERMNDGRINEFDEPYMIYLHKSFLCSVMRCLGRMLASIRSQKKVLLMFHTR